MKWAKLTKSQSSYVAAGLLLAVLAIAAFFRFYHLSSLPPGLHPDEAANGLDIIRMIERHDFRVLYNTNGPREALFFYFQAIFVMLFGFTALALRIAPALFGVGSVLGVYLLTKEWFSRRPALIAAFLMAVNSWATIINRDGFRANLVPFFLIWTFYAYTKAFRSKKTWQFAVAGALFGLGFYTYPSYRAILFIIGLVGAFAFFKNRKFFAEFKKPVLISWLVAAIILVPLGLYGLKQPGEVLGTRSSVSIFNKSLNHGSPIGTLVGNLEKTALMFYTHGDDNYRQNLGGAPMLDIFSGLFLFVGVIVSLIRLLKARYFIMLSWFGALALPMVLTAEGIPHGLRAVGMIPATFMLAGVGASWLLRVWHQTFRVTKKLGLVTVCVALLMAGLINYRRVFVDWANAAGTRAAYSEDMVQIAGYVRAHPDDGRFVLVIGGYGDKTVQFLTHNSGVSYERVDQQKISSLSLPKGTYQFVVGDYWQDHVLPVLQQKYPGGTISIGKSSADGKPLYGVYRVRIIR